MANSFHRAKLCEGALAWNLWRDNNPQVVPDLEQVVLAPNQRRFGLDDWGPIDLRRARLSGSDLSGACLTAADLEEAILAGVTLTGAKLDRTNLSRADLTRAVLDNADISGARLDFAIVNGARLQGVRNLTQSQLDRCLGDRSTTLPPGLEMPTSWLRRKPENETAAAENPMRATLATDGKPNPGERLTEEIFGTLERGRKALGLERDGEKSERPNGTATPPPLPQARKRHGRGAAFAMACAALAAIAAFIIWRQWLASETEMFGLRRGDVALQSIAAERMDTTDRKGAKGQTKGK